MKQILLSFCALAALTVNAQTFNVDGLEYTVNGEGTVAVTDEATKQLGSLIIPATVTNEGTTYTVNAIGEYAFQWSNITDVSFPETLDSINYCAFSSSNIGNVALPSGLKYIGGYAFSSCKSMTAIDIPASVEIIDNSAFFGGYGCQLANVTLHEGLKHIGRSAFYKQKLTEITIPASVDSIEKSAFSSCAELQTVTLSEGLKYLGDGVFYGCKSLTSITLPSTLETVGDELFMNATALSAINIPAGLTSIGNCFIAGTSVSKIDLDEGNTAYTLSDGVLYTKDCSLLMAAPIKGLATYTVNNKCLGIYGGAFMGSEIETVTLPAGLVAIDDYAFCQSQLSSIEFPSSLVWVGEQAFAATQLTSVTLPENFPYVNDGEFAGCDKLTTVVIPSGVQGIYNHAFNNCKALTTVTCKGSKAPTLEEWYEYYDHPFYNVPSSTKVYVPKGCKDSYEAEYWDDYLSLVESENGVLAVKSVSPEDGSALEKYNYYSYSVIFNEPITLISEAPEVYVRKGSTYSAATVAPAAWKAIVEAGNTLTIMGFDEDSYMDFWMADDDATYYVVIPAGIVKNEAGDENEQIVISLLGKNVAGIDNASADNGDGTVVARYNVNGLRIGSAQKGINIVRLSDGTVKKVLVK